jgi:hypothetical protein
VGVLDDVLPKEAIVTYASPFAGGEEAKEGGVFGAEEYDLGSDRSPFVGFGEETAVPRFIIENQPLDPCACHCVVGM